MGRNGTFFFYVTLWVLVTILSLYISDIDGSFTLFDAGQAVFGGTLAALLINFLDSKVIFRRTRSVLWKIILLRTVIHASVIAFLILAVGIPSRAILNDRTIGEVLRNDMFLQFLTGGRFVVLLSLLLVGSFVVNLVTEIRLILGPTVLANLFLGKYRIPTEEERIFMFLDLKESTRAAEELGDIEFLNYKKDFFSDLANPILSTGGEIYQYVGDEAVITWPLHPDTDNNGRYLACFTRFKKELEGRSDRYRERYNRVPEFKAGVHCGVVLASEMGTVKKDIVYSGNTLNVVARLEAMCNSLDKVIIISEKLVERTDFSDGYVPKDLGLYSLKGKREKMRLFTIENI